MDLTISRSQTKFYHSNGRRNYQEKRIRLKTELHQQVRADQDYWLRFIW